MQCVLECATQTARYLDINCVKKGRDSCFQRLCQQLQQLSIPELFGHPHPPSPGIGINCLSTRGMGVCATVAGPSALGRRWTNQTDSGARTNRGAKAQVYPHFLLSAITTQVDGFIARIKMSLTDLPDDLFILILAYLSPRDLIRSRRVSKNFNAAFTNPDVNRQLLVHRTY